MKQIFEERDIKNLNEIREFLDSNNIEYKEDNGNFCLNTGEKRGYEIHYISSEQFPIAYPKYNIQGVDTNFFYKLSYEAENEENSFKCWVKDYEWEDTRKKEVLKSYWTYAAGKVKNKFYARDCEVQVIPTKEAREFESEHCFYGKRGASLNLGLVTKKEKNGIPAGTLIMLYTFGKNFFGKDDSIEVLRVGTRKFCTVTGGASKLLTYFLENYRTLKMGNKHYPVDKLKFYSDYDHNIGASMEQLGFNFVSYSKGGFMNLWLETGEVKHREPGRHKLIMEKTAEGKLLAIPNAGVKTFELIVDKEKYPDIEINEEW